MQFYLAVLQNKFFARCLCCQSIGDDFNSITDLKLQSKSKNICRSDCYAVLGKKDIVNQMGIDTGLNKADSAKALVSFENTVATALSKGKGIRLIGFGEFSLSHRDARKGRNPQTGATITIAARNVPKFKAGTTLKKAVNK